VEALVVILVVVVVFGLGAVGGAVALFVLLPRLRSLEDRVERLQEAVLTLREALPRVPAQREDQRHVVSHVAQVAPQPPPRPEPEPPPPPAFEASGDRPVPTLPSEQPTAPEPPESELSSLGAELPVPASPSLPPGDEAARLTGDDEPAGPALGAASAATEADAPSWEEQVGSNWLNKLGVLVVVIGLALGVSYSFARVGPIGRIVMGFGLSAAMLLSGVVFARRERFANYGHGLAAGGWAGIYFTTYAMHGVDAVRLIESPLTGTLLLLVVAIGMIFHGLSYRSQTVTALTFIVGYATLSLTPLSVFALLAAVPLAASVMAVGERFGWTRVSVLGIAGTYGLIALRGLGIGGALETTSLTPGVLLAAYWVIFEVADVLGQRARARTAMTGSLAALNAVGFLTTVGLVLPLSEPERLSTYLAVMSAAAVASAVIRRRWAGRGSDFAAISPVGRFEPHHVPVLMSALLIAVSTGLRFEGAELTLRWLVEAELFFAAGVVINDGVTRRTGSVMMVLPVVAAVVALSQATWLAVADTTVVIVMLAATSYLNREWMRAKQLEPADLEGLYGWTGTGLLALAFDRELEGARLGLALMAAATALLEAGLRRVHEYRPQAYVLGGLGVLLTGFYFTGSGDAPVEHVWTLLPAAVLLSWGWAVRLTSRTRSGDAGLVSVAQAAAWAGTWLLAVFEWQVVADTWLAPALALTAAVLMLAPLVRWFGDLWWQGYALMVAAGLVATRLLTHEASPNFLESTALLIVVALMYSCTLIGPRRRRGDAAQEESLAWPALTLLSIFATGLLTALEWRTLSDLWQEPALGLTGLGLLVVGVVTRLEFIRWQGYLLALGASLSAALPILEPDPAFGPATVAALLCVALLYAVSAGSRLRLGDRAGHIELAALNGMFLLATIILATIEWRVLPDEWAGPVKALTGLSFVAAGVAASQGGLRAQGRGVLFAAAARMVGPIVGADTPTTVIVAGLFVIGCLYVAGVAAGRLTREGLTQAERRVDAIMLVTATVLLVGLIADELRPSLITAVWGLIGLVLLVAGFLARERVLRLSGLVVLAVCVLKLFLYDLRELEALARVMSFVVLGLVLLGVSWVYTRFGEQIRRYL